MSSPSSSSLSHSYPGSFKRSLSVGSNEHVIYHCSSAGEKLTLPEFVSNYHKSLPLHIRVCRGYCGPSEDTSISEGDHFNVHFIKHTTVVLVEMENGHQYNVPLNSAVPFGLLYDPYKNSSQASKGYTFTKVGDILQLPELPNIVRARKAHPSSNSENSIVANELLLVRRASRKRIGKNQLKVYSLTDKREKTLSESCIGHFSTKPRDVCMYLPDIVKHAPDIFPCKAVLFPNKESGSVPAKLTSSAVTLMHHSIETSLVVTSALDEETENARMLDIPIDLNIQVRVATTTELDAQKLARNTAYLYNHFNPSRLQSYVRSAQNRGMEETQNLLYRTVRPTSHHKGIKLTRPSTLPTSDSSSDLNPEEHVDSIYEDVPPLQVPHSMSPEPHYMSPRPAGTPEGEGPPLPDRNTVHKRTPGYSYVDVDNVRCAARGGAGHATRPVAVIVGSGDQASGSYSFGSTGSGGAMVERTMSEVAGGYKFGGSGGAEFSGRSSYSEGDLEVRRGRCGSRGGVAKPGDGGSRQEQELDACLLNLQEINRELDTALQEGEAERDQTYSHLHHQGPQHQQKATGPPIPRKTSPLRTDEKEGTPPTLRMDSSQELSDELRQKNLAYLKSLDNIQILKMLDSMGLSQYQEVFSSQQVNGDLLLECDDRMLECDLHVSSKLHRVRLLKIISGNYSVSDILSGRDGYVTMHPCK